MKVALTDRGIARLAKLASAGRRLEVLNTKMPGLALRVTPSGKRTWTVVWHQSRQTRRYAFGEYPTLPLVRACEKARQILAGVADGNDPGAARIEQRCAPTVAALAADYIE
jgi:hypothetical protein